MVRFMPNLFNGSVFVDLRDVGLELNAWVYVWIKGNLCRFYLQQIWFVNIGTKHISLCLRCASGVYDESCKTF